MWGRVAVCGLTLILVGVVASSAVAATPVARNPCAVADALLAAGEKQHARTEYIRLLRRDPSLACAKTGLKTINAAQPAPPKPKAPCAEAEIAFDQGDLDRAASKYRAVGLDTKCAEQGLAAVREVKRLCVQGRKDLALGRRDDAEKAFESALEKNPNANCASTGLQNSRRHWVVRTIAWTTAAVPNVLIALGLLAALIFLGLMLGYVRRLYPYVLRIPIAGRIVNPRVSLSPLDDKATKLDVGPALAARIKERLQRFKEEALRGGEPDYELDVGTPGDDFTDLVSESVGLENALKRVRELSDQTKIVGAVLDLLYAALPIRRLTVTGVLEPPARSGVVATLSLDSNGRVAAASSFAGPPLKRNPTAEDFLGLAQTCAVWMQYEVARELTRRKIEPDEAESYALVREGLDRQLAGQDAAARSAYEAALALNPRNWPAFVNLTVLEARLAKDFQRSVQIGEEAWEEMRLPGASA
jgi:tetratricopeptide (TPR) repeat protein